MSALEEIERQLLKSIAARAQPAERDARVESEYVARPVGVKRPRRRWRSLWSGGRLGLVLAAVVLASGVAAAAVLLDQPSAPLAGRVPAGQQPGYAVAGGYRYRLSVGPSLQVGQIGWCAAITTTSKSGQLEDLGTGSCGDAPTQRSAVIRLAGRTRPVFRVHGRERPCDPAARAPSCADDVRQIAVWLPGRCVPVR